MFFTLIKDLLFPKFCIGCSWPGAYICPRCRMNIRPVVRDTCIYCARASYLGLTHPICRVQNGIDGFLALYHYTPTLKRIIKGVKYKYAYNVLQDLMGEYDEATFEKLKSYADVFTEPQLQPIPLHHSRRAIRGFNQAEHIGRLLPITGKCMIVDLLIRSRATKPQAKLKSRSARYQNIRGAFEINQRNYKDHQEKSNKRYIHVMLIDDIVTTGSTVREAARVLKRQGVAKVTVFAIANGA